MSVEIPCSTPVPEKYTAAFDREWNLVLHVISMNVIDYHHRIFPEAVARLLPASEHMPTVWNPDTSIEFLQKHDLQGAV